MTLWVIYISRANPKQMTCEIFDTSRCSNQCSSDSDAVTGCDRTHCDRSVFVPEEEIEQVEHSLHFPGFLRHCQHSVEV